MREMHTRAGAKHARGRSNAPASSLGSVGYIRNALLVVATLIASTTYQTVLQPPSFLTKVDNNSTKGFQGYYASWITGPLGRDFAYTVFMSGNTLGFLVSVQMIICLTRDLPVRLPLLLSVAAMVQTYYCFTYYLPFTLLDKAFGLKNVELLSVLPVTMSILLLMAQRWLVLAIDFCLERLSRSNLLGDIYSLRTQSVAVNNRETREMLARAGAKRRGGRSNSPSSRLVSEEDQSNWEPATKLKILNQETESINDVRDTLLVVAALIASTTYQAVLQPPSFTIKANDSSMKGFLASYSSWVTHPLGRDMAYIGFISGNTFGLLLSIQMIICLTRDLPVRLPLLLSVTALVQTYGCFTYYLPFTLQDKASGLINVELLSALPVTMSILLLLVQRRLALALEFWLKRVSGLNFLGNIYSLRTQPVHVNDRDNREILTRAGAKHRRGRSNSPASRLVSGEDQSDGEPATSLKILSKEKSSIGNIRKALLVVAALIANATYQAVLQPPSFMTKVNHNPTEGFLSYYACWVTSPLGRDIAYIGFISGNTFGLLLSIQMIVCLTRGLPVRLPLLLSVTALVQTYYCFTCYLPFTLLDKVSGLNNVELLSALPVTTSVLLLLAQRPLALALEYCLERLSQFDLLGDMYSLRTPSTVVNDREMRYTLTRAAAKQGKGRSNSPASRLVSAEDQSDGKPVTNLKILIKEEESIGDICNALLAVATLIASATYQSVLQPPSFTVKVDDNSTTSFLAYYASWVTCPLGRDIAYIGFISGNTFGLLLSIQMIICLTRYFPVRLPLLLSMTALVQTYCCFTYYLPFTLLDKAFGLKNVELLSVLPVTMSILLLLAQRQLALVLDYWLKTLSRFNLLEDMYSLRPQSVVANDREIREIHARDEAECEREGSNSPASRLPSEEDRSDWEPVRNAPRSLSHSPSNNLNKEKESMGDIRNALLVVAALIASTTYQAVLQPPSFTTKVDRSSPKGFLTSYASWMTGPLGRDLAYITFMSGNTFGLLVPIQMIICLTGDLPVRLPLLLSVTAMVQTYYCFMYYLPFMLLDKAFGLKNVELLSVLLLTISIILLLIQRPVALALDFYLERLSRFNLLGDMYSMKT